MESCFFWMFVCYLCWFSWPASWVCDLCTHTFKLMLCCCCLESLNTFWKRDLHFYYVATPVIFTMRIICFLPVFLLHNYSYLKDTELKRLICEICWGLEGWGREDRETSTHIHFLYYPFTSSVIYFTLRIIFLQF